MVQPIRFSDKTEYEKIFKECYWGHFKLRSDNEERNKIIFKNRNEFVKEFSIKKYIKDSKYPFNDKINHYYLKIGLFDHVEVYSTHNKEEIVLINSPYGTKLERQCIKKWNYMEKIGWKPYNCLYLDANTYILKLNKNTLRNLKLKKKHGRCICDTCINYNLLL